MPPSPQPPPVWNSLLECHLFALEALIPFLLKELKLMHLILSYVAFLQLLLLEEVKQMLRDSLRTFLAPLNTLDPVERSF